MAFSVARGTLTAQSRSGFRILWLGIMYGTTTIHHHNPRDHIEIRHLPPNSAYKLCIFIKPRIPISAGDDRLFLFSRICRKLRFRFDGMFATCVSWGKCGDLSQVTWPT